jgi:hypothetical protein
MKKPLLIMNLAVGLFAVSAQGHSFDVAALVRDFVSDLSRLSEEQIHAVAQEDGAQFYYAQLNTRQKGLINSMEIGKAHALQHHLRDFAEIQYQITFSAAVDSLAINQN